jgi:hypothetical protein
MRGTTYRLVPLHTSKGYLPHQFEFSTERNSGGFHLDNSGGEPDLGREYLLFLNPVVAPFGISAAGSAIGVGELQLRSIKKLE